jgi:hypothetical protein
MEKEKRKHTPYTHQRLHLLLAVWFVVTFWMSESILPTIYPLIWLAPPNSYYTSHVYFWASLGWIPFAVLHIWRRGWHWLTVGLIVLCLLASNGVIGATNGLRFNYCGSAEAGLVRCENLCSSLNRVYTYKLIDHLPLMYLVERVEYESLACLAR